MSAGRSGPPRVLPVNAECCCGGGVGGVGVGAADGVIGPGGEPELVEKEKKKKGQSHLVTLGHAANCCQGVLEQASCQGRVMNDCAPPPCPLTSPTSPSTPTPPLPVPPPQPLLTL